MKLKTLFILVCSVCVGGSFAQPYASSNMTLASVLDPEPGAGSKYSGCWGYSQPGTGREYAILGSKNGTYWVDVTNPLTPTVAAYVAGTSSNGTWRELKTYGDYCYVISDDGGSTGFQVFDMSTLPGTVTLVSSNANLFRRGHACWIDDNKLYVSGITYSNNTSSSMNVYSLANPSSPVLLRELQQDNNFVTYVHDMFVRNDTVYASCGNQGLYVFKYNNGSNTFTQLGSLTTYPASGYNHASALTPNGQTLVFMDEVPASLPIKVANVSNLANMSVVSTCNQFPQTTPHNPFMVNNKYCFVSSYQDGTQLWDISNPASPVLAGFFDTYPAGGGNNNNWAGGAYSGQWGMFPYFPSGNIIALDRSNGLFVLSTNLYTVPEIQVMGNAVSINDGAVATTTANNTNFGLISLGNSQINTFSFENVGIATLSVSSMNISGTNASEFQFVGTPPSSYTVGGTASQSLMVQFTPTAAGTRTAILTVYNSDLNESIFQFVIEGGGVTPAGINNLQNVSFDLSIFPNPTRNEIEFTVPSNLADKEIELKIFDVNGKLAGEKQNGEIIKAGSVRRVQLNELNNGVYQISFMSDKKVIAVKKLLISK